MSDSGKSNSGTSNSTALAVNAVHLWRGEHHLLRGVSFTLRAGELLQVNGANGSGKTSLLRVVAGLLPAESGEIQWNGCAIQDFREQYAAELAYLGHANALKLDLTALENLHFGAALRGVIDEQTCLEVLKTLRIPQCAELPAKALSAGQKRRVALARVLLSRSTLWILDEPITNLDTSGIEMVESLMAEHLSRNGMILTAAHQPLLAAHAGTRTLSLH